MAAPGIWDMMARSVANAEGAAMWLDDFRPLTCGVPAPEAALSAEAFQPFEIEAVDLAGTRYPVRETVQAHLGFGLLRSFAMSAAPREPILVVPPLAGGHPFLMRDLVIALLPVCGAVAVADWPNARYLPKAAGRFGLAENIAEVAQMIRALGPRVHVVGVCQGAVPALAAAALLAETSEAPLSLSLLGGPIAPSRAPTNLYRTLRERPAGAIEQAVDKVPVIFPGMGRKVFPARRQAQAFGLYLWRQAMTGGELPTRLLFDDGADPVRFSLAKLCWSLMDVPGELFVENLAALAGEDLPRGTLAVAGHPVRLAALDATTLLTVEGSEDDIAAPGQTEAAHDLCAGLPPERHRRATIAGSGHFGLFYGRRMREEVVPAIAAAIAASAGTQGAGAEPTPIAPVRSIAP